MGGSNRRRSGRNLEANNGNDTAKSGRSDKKSASPKLKWSAPDVSAHPLPLLHCAYCGRPIRDVTTAIEDKSGAPVHFDCILAVLANRENLEKGDSFAYIGAGRFAIVHISIHRDIQIFKIKKIFEWENKEHKAEWRKAISDHYSLT
ncbi:MAG: hypothetical protein LBB43_02970 [Spirochaetaceae bacterium]|jgi:hypothetical protein|nr:hypothetical protein [Spirochaetaceae bacterium]